EAGPAPLVLARRDHRLDLTTPQVAPHPGVAVALVPGHCLGPGPHPAVASADADRLQHRLGVQALVPLASRKFGRQGQAVAVGHQMDFRAKAAPGAAQGVVGGLAGYFFFEAPAAARLARMEEPSTHHRSKSIRPCWSKRSWRASRMRSSKPERRSL